MYNRKDSQGLSKYEIPEKVYVIGHFLHHWFLFRSIIINCAKVGLFSFFQNPFRLGPCLFVLYGIWTLCTGSFQIKKKASSINSSSIENKFLVYLVHSLQLQTIKSSILISYINFKGLNWRHISCSPDPTTNFETTKSEFSQKISPIRTSLVLCTCSLLFVC